VTSRFEIGVVVRTICDAFRPLERVVEVWDGERQLRFRVINHEGKGILRASSVLVRRARDPQGLAYIVGKARSRIEAKGFKLDSWTPPK
jgi:hypothetical protein